MRRTDREIIDKIEIISVIEKCNVCRIALIDNNIPYLFPMNFGYEYEDDKLILYFHSANAGRKIEIIKKNPVACFEMDCSHQLIEANEACGYGMEYESVVGNGKISFCSEISEKVKALKRLMKKYVKDKDFVFLDSSLDTVTVFKLEVSDFTGKRRL